MRNVNTRNLSVSVMINTTANSKYKLLRRLLSNSIYSCKLCFIIILCSIILRVKLYRAKEYSKANTVRPQDQDSRNLLFKLCHQLAFISSPFPFEISP